jgi:tetratricopeptide (TPR) repeat protein
MIEPDDWLTKARQESRRLVIAAGLSDDDIHRLIKRAQFVSAALKENSLIETKRPQKSWWMSKNRIILLLLVSALAFPALAEPQPAGSPGAQSPAVTAGRNVTTSYGLSPEQVQELTKAAAAGAIGPLADRIVDLSNRLGVTEGAAVTMLRIIGEQDVPLELLPQKLAEVAERYRWARDRLAALDPQDAVTRELIERANATIKSGHLDEADQLLSQAEQAEVDAAHQAQQLAGQAKMTADQRLLRAAADRGVRGSIAMTRLRYLDAAQHFQEAANLVPAGRPNEKGGFLLATADALRHQGEERGDNAALLKAIENNQLALQELTASARLDWAS